MDPGWLRDTTGEAMGGGGRRPIKTKDRLVEGVFGTMSLWFLYEDETRKGVTEADRYLYKQETGE
jgi:hypothetical protein